MSCEISFAPNVRALLKHSMTLCQCYCHSLHLIGLDQFRAHCQRDILFRLKACRFRRLHLAVDIARVNGARNVSGKKSMLARSSLSSASSSLRHGARRSGSPARSAIRMVWVRPGSRSPAIRSICHGGCLSGGLLTRLMRPASSNAVAQSQLAEELRARCLRSSIPFGARDKISSSRHPARHGGRYRKRSSKPACSVRTVCSWAGSTTIISAMMALSM
jgi:hypothetical protein